MKRRSENQRNKLNFTQTNGSLQNPLEKSKNLPGQVWVKRNILKKLTLQMKFDKKSTDEYKKFRNKVNDFSSNHSVHGTIYRVQSNIKHQGQILTPKNKTGMRKLSTAKVKDLSKYTDNFFASKAFSKNGSKSYHCKSSALQGNNFINVNKIALQKKKDFEKRKDSDLDKKCSFSQRQRDQKQKDSLEFKHKRSFSHSCYRQSSNQDVHQKTDFLKVSTKQLHFNNLQSFFNECTKEKQFFRKKSKSLAKQSETNEISRQKGIQIEAKSELRKQVRPKSCIIKPKKSFQLNNCEGWTSENFQKQQEEPFSPYFRF